ncbi:MAG: pyridoxamine 5'-phosphate oxidase family protein [Rhodospirillales bacterium]|nr:pyridoxamine 5'-phosphate oxidase family protein [Rhodospirillales bacterium]MDP6773817.1 pyridoxamine 5'-phosphate oxidase family protein [Rhodospirillales bacterium]
MPMPEDVREILSDPIAVELLNSRIPARLAYRGAEGAPRVTPIWFHWNGEALILGTGPATHKARSLSRHPAVAVTIDSERPPYRSLQIRGTAKIDIVPGIPREYETSAVRYYGEDVGNRWVERIRASRDETARIAIEPEQAHLTVMERWLPDLFKDLPAELRDPA